MTVAGSLRIIKNELLAIYRIHCSDRQEIGLLKHNIENNLEVVKLQKEIDRLNKENGDLKIIIQNYKKTFWAFGNMFDEFKEET